MRYLLTTTYKDGTVARFIYSSKYLLKEMQERVENNDKYKNVASWLIEEAP